MPTTTSIRPFSWATHDFSNTSAEYMKRMLDPTYFFHEEYFTQLPLLNSDYAAGTPNAAEIALATRGNKNFETVGTNTATAQVTVAEGGGITLTTAGADNDQVIITTHRDTSHSNMFGMNWDSANEPYMRVDLVTAASITAVDIWAGFRSGDGGVGDATIAANIAEPADCFMLAYSDEGATSTTEWTAHSNRTGTDTATLAYPDTAADTTGITVAVSTLYRLEMWLNSSRVPQYYINGAKVAFSDTTALTAVSTLDPYVAVAASTGSAKAITVRNLTLSQKYG